MSAPAGVVDGLLAGRYRVTSWLAAGAVGEVWRARDLLLDRDVAVKTLHRELADDDETRERFRTEVRSTGRLSHPGIAAVSDAGEDDGRTWLVLELVEGESLQSLLRRSGRLAPERTLDLVAQTSAALQAAHDRGIVHRDVKPSNLLLRTDGTVKVTDFGIASVTGSGRPTRTGQVVGTASYLSPEQAAGAAATARSDLYALGVVAYQCLTGHLPFPCDASAAVVPARTRTPPPPLPPDVPPLVRDLVDTLLAEDPQARPASAGDVVRRAEAVLTSLARPGTGVPPPLPPGAPVAAVPAAPVHRPSRTGLAGRLGQRRAVRVTALLLGLLAVALGWRESAVGAEGLAPAHDPAPSSSVAPASPPAEKTEGRGG